MRMIGKTTTAAVALAFAIGLAACGNNTSSSQYAGTWKTKDTGGGDFDITLAADGKATGNRPGETLTGSWKEDGGAAVIKSGLRLDHEDRQGRRRLQEDRLREGCERRTEQQIGRRKGEVSAQIRA